MSKIDPELFSAHEGALAREYQQCPECGSPLAVRHGKHGAFLGCTAYPQCEYIRPMGIANSDVEKRLEGSSCPLCAHELVIRKGRYGLFIGCSQYPLCQHTENQDVMEEDAPTVPCPSCGEGHLVARLSRHGKQFYACDGYPKCKYVVNEPPVAQACPICGWSILVEKTTRHGKKLCCPQKLCQFQTDI